MTIWITSASIVVVAVVVELLVPGRAAYHTGWFNVAMLGLVVACVLAARRPFVQARTPRARAGIVAIVFGAAIAGFAGAASGLLAPDNRTLVASPGERVRVDDLGGTLDFPLVARADAVVLERPGRKPLLVGDGSRYAGSYIVRSAPRLVVYVEARDPHGKRLTITQPAGSSFLSPVLLMQQRQTIAGLSLPFDGFTVPAEHRNVKAVLFSAQEAATLRGAAGLPPGPAVLFAVDDENDRPLKHAIALARNGATVAVGGLLLRAAVLSYPAVDVIAVPPPIATIAGALLFVGGLALRLRELRTLRSG